MTDHKKQLMARWANEIDDHGNQDTSWREALTMEDQRFLERLDEMKADFWAETNDPESEEWREDLTPEEEEIVREWDGDFLEGYTRLLKDIADLQK